MLSLSKHRPHAPPLDRIRDLWHAPGMPFWMYLLRCGDGSFYIGHTDNLEARIGQHQLGRGCAYTAQRLPVTFAWAQDFPSRLEALESERQIKGWSRAKKEALIAGDWERVSRLAVSYAARASTGSARTVEGVVLPCDTATRYNHRVCAEDNAQSTHAVRPELVEGQATSETQ